MLASRIFKRKQFVRGYSEICSALYVPGNQEKMLNKCMQFKPSVVVPDIEDSVPPTEKANARKMISKDILISLAYINQIVQLILNEITS